MTTWWVIQKQNMEPEYKIGPFKEKQDAERWIRQARITEDRTLELEEHPNER